MDSGTTRLRKAENVLAVARRKELGRRRRGRGEGWGREGAGRTEGGREEECV